MSNPADPYDAAIRENATQTIENLRDECWPLRDALQAGTTAAVSAVYNMASGEVEIIKEFVSG
jgi:hypothetical protein